MTALGGAREGGWTWLRRLTARAMARDLAAFVVPGPEIARARGLDLAAAGLRPVATPRHANVLVVVGELPEGLRRAAAVAWAQMPRPRAILALGVGELAPLPEPDIAIPLGQEGLLRGLAELRQRFVGGAFDRTVADFDVAAVRTETTYTCPMHAEIVRDQQGSCPICGMDLVPREEVGGGMDHDAGHNPESGDAHESPEDPDSGAGRYTCPMHADIMQAEPGSCPICGMDLVPHDENTGEQGAAAGAVAEGRASAYTCPMHPEIDQAQPGSCPRCGMDLIPREAADASHDADSSDQEGGETPERHAGHGGMAAPDDNPHARPKEHGDHGEPGASGERQGSGEEGMGHEGDAAHGGHRMGGMDHGDEHAGHDMGDQEHGDEHAGHAMDHGDGQGDGGFMSMVMMTQDLPRSADGLPMEWLDVPFGPLSPALPGGLDLTLTLDGDTVAEARVARGAMARDLDATWPGPVATLPDRLAGLDPLAPIAYRLLAQRAVEAAAGVAPDEATARARVGALERERAASHLNWLVAFLGLLGERALAAETARLQHALWSATDGDAVARHQPDVAAFARRVLRRPLLARRLRDIGALGATAASPWTGPVARSAGAVEDRRVADPAYRALGFAPIVRAGADAWTRLEVRLAELVQSLDLVGAAGAVTLPPWAAPAGAGEGQASVETPRGAATLRLALRDGVVREAVLETPSTAHLAFVQPVAEGCEVADALIGVASLDLSPWEIER